MFRPGEINGTFQPKRTTVPIPFHSLHIKPPFLIPPLPSNRTIHICGKIATMTGHSRLAKRVLHPSKNPSLCSAMKAGDHATSRVKHSSAFCELSRRQWRQLVCNRWCIVEPTFNPTKDASVARFACSAVHAWLPLGIASNKCVILKNVAELTWRRRCQFLVGCCKLCWGFLSILLEWDYEGFAYSPKIIFPFLFFVP